MANSNWNEITSKLILAKISYEIADLSSAEKFAMESIELATKSHLTIDIQAAYQILIDMHIQKKQWRKRLLLILTHKRSIPHNVCKHDGSKLVFGGHKLQVRKI